MRLLRALALLLVAAGPLAGQARRPVTSEDYSRFNSVGDPVCREHTA